MTGLRAFVCVRVNPKSDISLVRAPYAREMVINRSRGVWPERKAYFELG